LDATDPDDNLHGTPELVVEVLSPSNTASEMLDRETMCLENGCQEFWVADPKRESVRITTARGEVKTYRSGDSIPLRLFGGEWKVSEIFVRS
jgi:Uma2 family endonuclease